MVGVEVLIHFLCFYFLVRFLHKVWWIPTRLLATMKSQGIKGPSYKFPYGNTKEISHMRSQSMVKCSNISHDTFPRIHPHVYSWTKIYGMNFLHWHGSQGQMTVTEPDLVKEILLNREGFFQKKKAEGYAKKLMGESLVNNEGEKWAKIRKLANHTFHAESLKSMIPEMNSSVLTMLERWKNYEGKEIDVYKEIGLLTTEVIARTAFGSNYLEGKSIFEMKAKLRAIITRNLYKVRFPGISMILKYNDAVEAYKLDQRIKTSILDLVKKRESSENGEIENFGNDYLGQLVKISHESDIKKRITLEEMVDEVKVMYGAGYHTVTSMLAWCILLLATNTDWQEKARAEVKETFDCQMPNSDGISRLKIMNMIINECLRLYPPALNMTRTVAKEGKIGNLILPPNTTIDISVLALHHNSQIWGEDAHLFKPERFAQGVAKATNNNSAAFLPFGMGPRICVGLNFATIEAKIALSMILQRYKFILSPNYVHYPADTFILTPKNGVQVILKAI